MRNSLMLFCPSTGGHEDAVTSWKDTMIFPWPVEVDATTEGDEAGFLTKCDKAWRKTDAKIVGFLHSDLFIHEHDWDLRVLAEFQDESVGVIGFVGAEQLGSDDIYKVPYDYRQLARYRVLSNLTDAEIHGERFHEAKDVAVVDSCAVFVRTELLRRLSGWPIARYPDNPHCSDLWICCSALRLGYRVRLVGVSATHRSGGKGEAGSSWLEQRGGDLLMHRQAHETFYNEFRDMLPVRVASSRVAGARR